MATLRKHMQVDPAEAFHGSVGMGDWKAGTDSTATGRRSQKWLQAVYHADLAGPFIRRADRSQ